jgi:hypothetical protein
VGMHRVTANLSRVDHLMWMRSNVTSLIRQIERRPLMLGVSAEEQWTFRWDWIADLRAILFDLDDLPTEELAARLDDMERDAAAHFNLPLRKGLHA